MGHTFQFEKIMYFCWLAKGVPLQALKQPWGFVKRIYGEKHQDRQTIKQLRIHLCVYNMLLSLFIKVCWNSASLRD